jgi:hypothetical protein
VASAFRHITPRRGSSGKALATISNSKFEDRRKSVLLCTNGWSAIDLCFDQNRTARARVPNALVHLCFTTDWYRSCSADEALTGSDVWLVHISGTKRSIDD